MRYILYYWVNILCLHCPLLGSGILSSSFAVYKLVLWLLVSKDPSNRKDSSTLPKDDHQRLPYLPSMDKKFLVDRLSRYLIFRLGVLSSHSTDVSNASSLSASSTRDLLNASLHPVHVSASAANPNPSSRSPTPTQTLAGFFADPYVAKLLSLLAWSKRDFKKFLQASRTFKQARLW